MWTASLAHAEAVVFMSTTPAATPAAYNSWLSAIGETPDTSIDYESYADHTNLDGVLLPEGLTITDPEATEGGTVESQKAFFDGANPIGLRSLAVVEPKAIPLVIELSQPADYFGFYRIHNVTADARVVFEDQTTFDFQLGNTPAGGTSFGFCGVWRNNRARIVRVEIKDMRTAGISRWGIDTVEFGRMGEILSPVSEQVLLGTKNGGGNLASWSAVDGDLRTICKFFVPNINSPFVNVNLNFSTHRTNLASLIFQVRVANEPGGVQEITLLLQNKVTGTFEPTSVVAQTTAANTTYGGTALGALSNYISPAGEITAQLQVKAVGFQATAFPCLGFDAGTLAITD